MSELRLSAELRTEFGKGGARRTRRSGRIPAVLYGHGADPQHVSLPAREFTNAIRHGGANVLLTLDIDGTEALAIPKAIQRHAVKGTYDHIDLLAVRRGEKITVDVPVLVEGEVAPGALLQQEATTISLEVEATNIPTEITVNIEGAESGTQITAADLPLPTGSTLAIDAETLILLVSTAPTAEQLDAEVEAAEAELGIVEDKPAAETEGAADTDAAGE